LTLDWEAIFVENFTVSVSATSDSHNVTLIDFQHGLPISVL